MTQKLSLIAAALVLTGCANATFNFTDKSPTEADKPKMEQRQANFFSGFGQKHNIDPVKVCGGLDKVASVDVNQSFTDALIATVTLGIYTPLSARVYCK
jgi:Bor protein